MAEKSLNLNQTRFLQPLRSNTVHSTYQAAIEDIAAIQNSLASTSHSDGISVVARFRDENGVGKSVLGIYSQVTNSFTYFVHDVEAIEKIIERVGGLEEKVGSETVINRITTEIQKLDSELNYDGQFIDVTIKQVDGVLTELSVTESDIASAKALADEVSARTSADSALDERIDALEEAIGEGGSVEAQITKAIEGLDVETIGGEGKIVTSVSETDGKISATVIDATASNIAVKDDSNLFTADNVEGVLTEIETALNQEIKDRQDADSVLEEKIADAEAAAKAAATIINEKSEGFVKVSGVQDSETKAWTYTISEQDIASETALTQEIQDRKLADNALDERIDDVIKNAKSYSIVPVTEGLESNVKEAYQLQETIDGTSTKVGSIIKIYKDSALQKAELVEQELQFTYLLADGTTELVKIDVSKFLAESEFKNGLEVSDNVVSVKLGEDTETNKNYLDFEGDVEGEKSLAVRSIDTDSTKLQKDLKIAGLASQFGAGNYNNNDVIPAGTDLYTILQNFLCKELWPTNVTKQSASASSSMSNLTLTLSKTGTQEVGTLVKLTAGRTNGSSVSSSQNSVLSGLEYGYSFEDDNTMDSSATTITKTISTAISDNNYTVSATINSGFNADAKTNIRTTPSTVTGVGSAALAETTLGCIVEGKNEITINATGASYSYSAETVPSVYYISNLGNTNSAKTHSGITAVNSTTNKPTKSANATVTGSYYYFLGYSEKTAFNQFDSASVRALTTKSSWVTKDGTTTIVAENAPITSNGKSIVIACPSKYKLASISNGVGADILANFSSVGEVDVTTGSIVTKYKVYVYPITNGATVEFKKVTLAKA